MSLQHNEPSFHLQKLLMCVYVNANTYPNVSLYAYTNNLHSSPENILINIQDNS